MTFELIIIAGVLATIIGAFFYGKIQAARAKAFQAEAKAAQETIATLDEVIEQHKRTETALSGVQIYLTEKRRQEQAKIDAGDRDAFESDSF